MNRQARVCNGLKKKKGVSGSDNLDNLDLSGAHVTGRRYYPLLEHDVNIKLETTVYSLSKGYADKM